jgi:choline kinase
VGTNILVLAAGNATTLNTFPETPICLSEHHGSSVLEAIVNNTQSITSSEYIFAISKKDDDHFHLGRIAKLLAPNAKITVVPESTKGSACTALLAACTLNIENSLLIVSANELIDEDLSVIVNNFEERCLDGGTITFRSIQPRYSYVRLDSDGFVIEAAQKKPISQHATTGLFWYRSTFDFIESAKEMIRKHALVGDSFYVAPTFNDLILNQKRIGVVEIDPNKYHPIKTDTQLKQFELTRSRA